MMIICGSAASWIIKKVFRNRGGLHNRVTCRIFVKPFTLHECQQFTESKKYHISQYDILEAYMIMGGIPYYWTLLDTTRSITDNIDKLFFSRDGALHCEFNELYDSLFKNPEAYIKIVKTLAEAPYGLTREDIIAKAKIQK